MRNEQLGFDLGRELALAELLPKKQRTRALGMALNEHRLLSTIPEPVDLTFNHSGLCQTFLPHARPATNTYIHVREAGRFTLMVSPGVLKLEDSNEAGYAGVPYGSKARLIMFHLQTEGLKSRTVTLGKNLSAFLQSLELAVTGGKRGTINAVREQSLRIARCTFSMQWNSEDGNQMQINDRKIVQGMEMWTTGPGEWKATVELGQLFHDHLCEHAVPLDKRGIALLKNNSLGLDLYAWFAYRLPRLKKPLHMTWEQVAAQMGASGTGKDMSRNVREILPLVQKAYPDAKFDVELATGRSHAKLILLPSAPAVPKGATVGFRLLKSDNTEPQESTATTSEGKALRPK